MDLTLLEAAMKQMTPFEVATLEYSTGGSHNKLKDVFSKPASGSTFKIWKMVKHGKY